MVACRSRLLGCGCDRSPSESCGLRKRATQLRHRRRGRCIHQRPDGLVPVGARNNCAKRMLYSQSRPRAGAWRGTARETQPEERVLRAKRTSSAVGSLETDRCSCDGFDWSSCPVTTPSFRMSCIRASGTSSRDFGSRTSRACCAISLGSRNSFRYRSVQRQIFPRSISVISRTLALRLGPIAAT